MTKATSTTTTTTSTTKMDESGFESGSAVVSENAVEVNKQIWQVEIKITHVENAIEKLERAIETATTSEEKSQLRAKELKLLDKESQLREEKSQLREEKSQLRTKESQLREEKSQLREKESQLREEKLLLLRGKKLVSAKDDADRLIGVDFRIAEESLKHSFDLKRFMSRVNQLFQWWETTGEYSSQNYMAPYFPCVQSSGMGKTKLLSEAHRQFMKGGEKNNETKDDTKNQKRKKGDDDGSLIQKTSSALILCRLNSPVHDDKPDIYTHVLVVPQELTDDTRNYICEKLNTILAEILSKEQTTATTANTPTESVAKSKVVFFVDEAQHLLTNDAFGFRCVRWWLRSTGRPDKTQVAAVFAGTSSGLANFYRDDPVVTQYSRDANSQYCLSGSKLFEPFFDLCTIGVFVKRTQSAPADAHESDYARAIPYGRPLFALLQQHVPLTTENERVILRRMTLSVHAWFEDDQACLSVLGTRVQMGQTSISIASQLVKKGYANLTYFCGPAQIAQIAYMPDPVCARLAMCVMDPAWKMEGELCGREKKLWSAKMGAIISTGLCRPHKGNAGEIASALYLLFCGDMLRASLCKPPDSYHTFQVPVLQFLQVAFKSVGYSASTNASEYSASTNASTTKASVSFIQVCRSHARPSSSKMFMSSSLEWLYHAACACYCYEGCPAIDWYAPICCFEEGEPYFVPLAVSVKARRKMSKPERIAALAAMRTEVAGGPLKVGICVLFLIGLDNPKSIESGFYSDKGEKIDTPNELKMSSIWNVQVSVQSDDTFGLSDVVTQTTLDGDATAEVYTSHGFLHAYSRTEGTFNVASLLRKTKPNKESDYITELCEAFGQIDVVHDV
jgi:hypothetical protein